MNKSKKWGSLELTNSKKKHNIRLLTIIGEIEGHEAVNANTKATKYEHYFQKLAEIEDDEEIEGLLNLLNTLGGDVEAGLAIAEMIASLSISYGISGSWRRPFDWCSDGCFGRLFFCSAKCDHGDSPGAFQRDVYRSGTNLSEYGKNPGPNHHIYF